MSARLGIPNQILDITHRKDTYLDGFINVKHIAKSFAGTSSHMGHVSEEPSASKVPPAGTSSPSSCHTPGLTLILICKKSICMEIIKPMMSC